MIYIYIYIYIQQNIHRHPKHQKKNKAVDAPNLKPAQAVDKKLRSQASKIDQLFQKP